MYWYNKLECLTRANIQSHQATAGQSIRINKKTANNSTTEAREK